MSAFEKCSPCRCSRIDYCFQICHPCFRLTVSILCMALLGSLAPAVEAVYEGTANANMMIRRYERKEQFLEAALWREAAAKCLDVISIPLAEIVIEYCQRSGNVEVVQKMKAEIADTKAQRDEYLKLARVNREKAMADSGKPDAESVKAESARIDRFIAEWVSFYPDRFYQFGTYRNVFGNRIGELKESGRFADALLLEAEASDMCARQYDDVTIRYFRSKAIDAKEAGDSGAVRESMRQLEAYQKVRDDHLRRSAMLRALAKQNPRGWPAEADKREFDTPKSKNMLTAEKAIEIARKDERIQEILKEHGNIREFASFQGFCWTVSYYTRDWRNLAIVFVDDRTGKVTDILFSAGNLEKPADGTAEERGERDESLRLSSEEVIKIAREHPEVKSYFESHPGTRASAGYNRRYNCWIIEVILNDREVGVVTVSDKTGKVLEVDLGRNKG